MKKIRTDLLMIFVVSIIGLGFYIYKFDEFKFSSSNLSGQPSDWGAFGEYLNVFVGIINLIILYRISEVANNIAKGSLRQQLKSDIYNDFLQRIDNNTDSIILYIMEQKYTELKIISHVLLGTVENGMNDFDVLNEQSSDFKTKCNSLMTAIKALRDNSGDDVIQELLHNLLEKKSDVRIYLYEQINGLQND